VPILSIAVASAAVLLGVSAVALDSPGQARATEMMALEQTTAPATCDTPQHHQLDFWVGNWQVFDAETNQLVAFERVEKHSEGCIVQENLTFLTDMYRRPGVKYRSRHRCQSLRWRDWLQMWADNQWGAIFLAGAPDADGNMVFVTVIPSRKRDVKLVYENRPDGTCAHLAVRCARRSGKWVKYGDLINRPNR